MATVFVLIDRSAYRSVGGEKQFDCIIGVFSDYDGAIARCSKYWQCDKKEFGSPPTACQFVDAAGRVVAVIEPHELDSPATPGV